MNAILFIKIIISILLIHIAVTDLKEYRIPNADIILLLLSAFFYYERISMITIFINLFLEFIIFSLIIIKYRRGLGMGDIKLLVVLTPILGINIWPVIWIASLTGIIHFLFLRKVEPNNPKIPFGLHISLITVFFLLADIHYFG